MKLKTNQYFEIITVCIFSFFISLCVFAYIYSHGWTNLYGDGKSHVAIARKIIDMDVSTTIWERYVQLGSPWLPLPHLLTLLFVWKDSWWRSGLAGSFISLASFIIGAIFLFKLACLHYRKNGTSIDKKSLLAPYLVLAVYLSNPSLLYMQTTPMTEALFLAIFIVSIYFLRLWIENFSIKILIISGFFTSLMTLTRYEGWAIIPTGIIVVTCISNREKFKKLLDGFIWGLTASLGILYWLWHNWAIYGRTLEFYSGIYSTKGYFLRHKDLLSWGNFAVGNPIYAATIIILTIGICSGPAVFLFGMIGCFADFFHRENFKSKIISLLLFIPGLFTVYSIYTGNIQIYPFFLNVRYGLSTLAGLGLFLPGLIPQKENRKQLFCSIFLFILIGFQSGYLLQSGFSQLSIFREGYFMEYSPYTHQQKFMGEYIKKLPPGQTLMYTGEFATLIAESNLTYSQILHEGKKDWALVAKGIPLSIDYVVYKEGDELDLLFNHNPTYLKDFSCVLRTGQPSIILLQRKTIHEF